MLDIKWIRENSAELDRKLAKRGLKEISKQILMLDEQRRETITLLQQLQSAKNVKAKLIPTIKNKDSLEFKMAVKDASDLRERISLLEKKLENEDKLTDFLSSIPNLPDDEVPFGKDENDNKEIKRWGKIREFSFKPKQHFELGDKLGMMDFEQTAKISGSRFLTLSGCLAKLERALANFMLDIHTKEFGYKEYSVPHLVRDDAMYGVGQLPKFAADSFATTDGFRLIPTAEVSLTNMVRDMIIDESILPLRMSAFSLCFRSEAGSGGKDTRGMIRNHQFSKVELVSITKPEDSEQEHERMTSAAEEILKRLGLPYRVMILCSGDIGFSSKKTYDLEVWLPGQGKYREISSCSNCSDFQARRMKARYKSINSKENIFVHTLNGSALAVGRTIVAIMENYQNEDASITIPEALVSYMGGISKIG